MSPGSIGSPVSTSVGPSADRIPDSVGTISSTGCAMVLSIHLSLTVNPDRVGRCFQALILSSFPLIDVGLGYVCVLLAPHQPKFALYQKL